MTVAFCGHSNVYYDTVIEEKLIHIVENLIINGATEFFTGGYGTFDKLSAKIIRILKEKYPHIKSTLVIPYLDRKYDLSMYDDVVYPPLEKTPLRFAISKRNQWMVNNSDVLVAYVEFHWGGAEKMLAYAKQKKKKIINICQTKNA